MASKRAFVRWYNANTMKTWHKIFLAVIVLCVLGAAAMALPPIRDRVTWRVDQLRLRAYYLIKPPEKAVFKPNEQVATLVQATLTQLAALATPTPVPSPTITPTPLPPNLPTPTATPTLAPLPAAAEVQNVPYVDQHYGFNNCAPSNLTMALEFWGWAGTREDVSKVVKPFEKDKNVMPYELVDYVNEQTNLRALTRVGGTDTTLKRMIVAGYPVIVESGVYLRDLSGVISWMGHYQVVYGFDDAQKKWKVKDSFEPNGSTFTVAYDEMTRGWRSFNDTFVVVYPAEKETDVLATLGVYADEAAANQIAAQAASDEISTLDGQDQFFAWYNRGSSLVRLQDFNGAAQAYDSAFQAYAALSGDKRPWRIVWYETGPYFAYYYTGRYSDVANLADTTINAASEPFLEESFYWRAQAKVRLGDNGGAVEDLRKSLEYHPNFGPSTALMQQLGVSP